MPPEELRHQLEVNVIAQLAVTQACFPALRRNKGRIVNVSSISGRVALPLYGPYAASKYALEALSDSLRREQQDVEVVLVEPGAIATPIWARGLAAGDALWQAMPPQAHERYGALVARLRKEAEKQGTEGAPPETVARTIATALAADRPRTRYVVGTDARVQALLSPRPARPRRRQAARQGTARLIVEQSRGLWNNTFHDRSPARPARVTLLRHHGHRSGARTLTAWRRRASAPAGS